MLIRQWSWINLKIGAEFTIDNYLTYQNEKKKCVENIEIDSLPITT